MAFLSRDRKRKRKDKKRMGRRKKSGGFYDNNREWSREQEVLQRAHDAAYKKYEEEEE